MSEKRSSFMLVSTLLTLSFGVWVLSFALTSTVGRPEQTKTLLRESGIYAAIIPTQLAQAQEDNPSIAALPLDSPEVQNILGKALDAKQVQQQGDQAVDNIYTWLDGEATRPNITIDATPDRQSLALAAGEASAKHAAALPACAPGENPGPDVLNNPLSATCLPPGISSEAVGQYVSSAIAGSPVLALPVQLTDEDIKLTNGKTIMESFAAAPAWYQRLKLLPLIAAVSAALLAVLSLVLLRPLGGAWTVGKHALVVGVTLGLCAFLLTWGLEKLFESLIPAGQSKTFGDALMRLSMTFNAAYRNNIIHYSLLLGAAGAGVMALAYVLKRAQGLHLLPKKVPATHAVTHTATAEPAKSPAETPKKRARHTAAHPVHKKRTTKAHKKTK